MVTQVLSPKALLRSLALWYVKRICRHEFEGQQFIAVNERPIEYRFVFEQLTAAFPRTVLDVGTGLTALPQLMRTCGFLVTAIDNIRDYWPEGMVNRHYHVLDDDILQPRVPGPFDFITCVSTLEHIRDASRAVRSMFSLLRPGGRLVITCPYNEQAYVPNVYALPGSIGADKYPFVTQAFSRRELDGWIQDNRARLVAQEYWRFFDGPYWTLGARVLPERTSATAQHQISCIALEKAG